MKQFVPLAWICSVSSLFNNGTNFESVTQFEHEIILDSAKMMLSKQLDKMMLESLNH